MLTDIAPLHYTTKILPYLKENRLVTIVSITKGAKIVVSKIRTIATTKPRKKVNKNDLVCSNSNFYCNWGNGVGFNKLAL